MQVTSGRPMFLIVLAALLFATIACGSSPQQVGQQASASNDVLELTDEMINERINGAFLNKVPEENGAGEPISWTFIPSEPKEITVVDKQVNGDKATIVLDIKTTSSPRSRDQRQLEGRIKTEWEIRTGWVLRQWEIIDTENISLKYKNLAKEPSQNTNKVPDNSPGRPQN